MLSLFNFFKTKKKFITCRSTLVPIRLLNTFIIHDMSSEIRVDGSGDELDLCFIC